MSRGSLYLLDEATRLRVYDQGYAKGYAEACAKGKPEAEAKAYAAIYADNYVLGWAQGKAKEKLETARKMKELKVSIDIIMQVTGLAKEEIEKL